MKATVYVPDELAREAGSRYHKAKRDNYSMSELCRVGLALLAGSNVKEIRELIPKSKGIENRRPPDIPGLREYRPTNSD